MNYKVNWSRRSQHDLEFIYESVLERSPAHAKKLIKAIFDKSDILYDHPRSGQKEELLAHKPKGFRYLVCQNYKIIYAVFEEHVTVYTVFDTRQDPSKLRVDE